MRVRKRKIIENVPEHIYVRGVRKQILFFDDIDRLVYYTRYAVSARKRGVKTLALSIMLDHLHGLSIHEGFDGMSAHTRDCLACFARDYNVDADRKGPLFECAFGSAAKTSVKMIRSTIIYIGNNQVEKHLCEKAEDCRWSFVAYLADSHPYSEALERSRMSNKLKLAVSCVDTREKANLPLSFSALRFYFKGLSVTESEQLIDYIIVRYFPIDRKEVLSFFNGDYENLLTALHATSGNDYEIKEDYTVKSDEVFTRLLQCCSKSSFRDNPKRIQTVPEDRKRTIATFLRLQTGATEYELRKFLDM